jgi:hypothetical protein
VTIEEVVMDKQQQPIELPLLTRVPSHTTTKISLRPRRALRLDLPDGKTKKRSMESQTPKVNSRRSPRKLALKRMLSLDSMYKTPSTLEFQTPKAQSRKSLRRLSPKGIFTLDSSKVLRKGSNRFSRLGITMMADNDVQATPKPTAVMPPIAMTKRVRSLDSSTLSKRHAERSPSKGLEKKNLPGSASNASNIDKKSALLMEGSPTRQTPKKLLQAAMERSPSKRLHKKHQTKSDSKISEMTPSTPTSNRKMVSCNDLIRPPPEENPRTPRKPHSRKSLQVESNFKALNSKLITTVGVEASPASPAASPATNSATRRSLDQKRKASMESRQKLKDAFKKMFGTAGSEDNSVSAISPRARTQKKYKRIAEIT